jgi:hypothetical protein
MIKLEPVDVTLNTYKFVDKPDELYVNFKHINIPSNGKLFIWNQTDFGGDYSEVCSSDYHMVLIKLTKGTGLEYMKENYNYLGETKYTELYTSEQYIIEEEKHE